MGPRKDPNAIDIDKEERGDRICYVCGKWGYMAKNCWERHKRRIVEMPQELAKENGGQPREVWMKVGLEKLEKIGRAHV